MEKRLGEIERALRFVVQDRIPIDVAHAHQQAIGVDAGIVDENVPPCRSRRESFRRLPPPRRCLDIFMATAQCFAPERADFVATFSEFSTVRETINDIRLFRRRILMRWFDRYRPAPVTTAFDWR